MREEQREAFLRTSRTDVERTLTERGKSYGDVVEQAMIGDRIIVGMRYYDRHWDALDPEKKYALIQIAYKISRLIAGNSNHVDSWKDIEGYARLVRERLPGVDSEGGEA